MANVVVQVFYFLLLLGASLAASSTEWRVANSQQITGFYRLSELEFYLDSQCTRRALPWDVYFSQRLMHNGVPQAELSSRHIALDGNLASVWDMQCPEGCPPEALVFSAVFRKALQIRCVALAQPADSEGKSTIPRDAVSIKRAAPGSGFLGNSNANANATKCPGPCRSGRYLEADNAPCDRSLNDQGWCGDGPSFHFDCRACRGQVMPKWIDAGLTEVQEKIRDDGTFALSMSDHAWSFPAVAPDLGLTAIVGIGVTWLAVCALLCVFKSRGKSGGSSGPPKQPTQLTGDVSRNFAAKHLR
eukprot:TRINITY_DN44990_c0_g1_i1.p1 TRINITY_DN44990_c0_g1~~TRINITY_DN44990_c0_g1_i1.p1  ORF type:complete len:302 (+),score=45.99 TRINITY_DN44990_c0_g1_i1:119-1024(+)